MSSTPVESLITRCLMEPRLLSKLLPSPACPLAQRDLKRLRLFAGFISKVQHNDLWDDFSGTRRWLRSAGIELEVFSEYRIKFFRPGMPQPTGAAKIRRFIDFLESRLAESRQRELRGLTDVVQHEKNLWDISRNMDEFNARGIPGRAEQVAEDAQALCNWHEFSHLVPRFNGCVRLVLFDHDPVKLIAALERGDPWPPAGSRVERVALAYWKAPNKPCRILRMEPYEAMILTEVNGRRSVRAVIARSRANGLGMIAPKRFHDFFRQAATAGILGIYERMKRQ